MLAHLSSTGPIPNSVLCTECADDDTNVIMALGAAEGDEDWDQNSRLVQVGGDLVCISCDMNAGIDEEVPELDEDDTPEPPELDEDDTPQAPEIWNAHQVASFLGVEPSAVYSLLSKKSIPTPLESYTRTDGKRGRKVIHAWNADAIRAWAPTRRKRGRPKKSVDV